MFCEDTLYKSNTQFSALRLIGRYSVLGTEGNVHMMKAFSWRMRDRETEPRCTSELSDIPRSCI